MLKLNSTAASLVVASLAAGAVVYGVEHYRVARQAERTPTIVAVAAEAKTQSPSKLVWAASAAGRVEVSGGEVRIGAQVPGRVARVLVHMNDSVQTGDLLVMLSDEDIKAKLTGALAEAAVRKRERDEEEPQSQQASRTKQQPRNGEADAKTLATDRQKAVDAAFDAERTVAKAQAELDELRIRQSTGANVAAKQIADARTALATRRGDLDKARADLTAIEAKANMPLPTRLDSGLAAARAEVALLQVALERMRIRAPSDGTVLQVSTRAGEIVTPSPEDVLLNFGDLSKVKIRAEVEERDVSRIRTGQAVVIRSDAFSDREFTGRVERMARALGAPQLAGKGPRRPMEQEVLQVLIDIEGRPELLPGMRVDVFFKPDATADGSQSTRTN
ncbi:MAG: HlyD family secretion protein [Hyphomicrobiaceae bacterium]